MESLSTNLDLIEVLEGGSSLKNYEVLYEAVVNRLGDHLSYEDRVTLEEFCRRFSRAALQRWKNCGRNSRAFRKNYEVWLQANVDWPSCVQTGLLTEGTRAERPREDVTTAEPSSSSSVGTMTKRSRKPFEDLGNKQKKRRSDEHIDADEDSNSSIKFSSEIWSYFETEGDIARCAVCRQEAANTVEDMRGHLEEEHPGLMIGILSKKSNSHTKDDNDATDDERAVDPIEEDVFTDVLYLEEEKPRAVKRSRPSRTSDQKHTRTLEQRNELQTQKIEYTVMEKPSESRPEIDAFLTYIGVLLKNVPKETMPKLQLDIISSILNAQMANNTTVPVTSIIPVSNTVTIPVTTVTSDNLINNGGILHTETAKYHITIDNGLVQKSP